MYACCYAMTSGVERGGQGGLVPRGPGQWAVIQLFFVFLIGSQWGIQDFDKGGPT